MFSGTTWSMWRCVFSYRAVARWVKTFRKAGMPFRISSIQVEQHSSTACFPVGCWSPMDCAWVSGGIRSTVCHKTVLHILYDILCYRRNQTWNANQMNGSIPVLLVQRKCALHKVLFIAAYDIDGVILHHLVPGFIQKTTGNGNATATQLKLELFKSERLVYSRQFTKVFILNQLQFAETEYDSIYWNTYINVFSPIYYVNNYIFSIL